MHGSRTRAPTISIDSNRDRIDRHHSVVVLNNDMDNDDMKTTVDRQHDHWAYHEEHKMWAEIAVDMVMMMVHLMNTTETSYDGGCK